MGDNTSQSRTLLVSGGVSRELGLTGFTINPVGDALRTSHVYSPPLGSIIRPEGNA